MPSIGFSTGALFREAFSKSVAAARKMSLDVIELSALRTKELKGLFEFVQMADLHDFKYVSIHAPTDYAEGQEREVATTLLNLVRQYGWNVIIHPDSVSNFDLWVPFGEHLCIENMDKRKSVGRTVEELCPLFDRLPLANLCFDIAHAHQVDTSMTEAYRILREFRQRISQLHVSEVTSAGNHDRISEAALSAFLEVADHLPRDVPVILETPVPLTEAGREIRMAARIFEPVTAAVAAM